jgi:hypothetical protein
LSKIIFLTSILMICACGPSRHSPNGDDDGTDANTGSGNTADAPACATATVTAMTSPLDLYVMLDQSGSMTDPVSGGGDKWSAVTSALSSFVAQPGLTGISMGLQYFGLEPDGIDDSCTASDYATPEVEIAALPGVGGMITASMATHSPSTGTPTSAALQGAINHASAWATAHTGDVAAVVLATDGDPEECDTNLTHIDTIAATGYAATPKIATFVIGVGTDTSNLNGIAMSGGTTSAFIVDTNSNVNAQFLAAMNAIRNSASCQYQIPVPTDGSMPNFNEVNVVFTPSNGSPMTIPQVPSAAMCPATGDGWYYNNPAAPTAILLCTSTCGTIQADASGSVNIALGCSTVIL